MPKAETRTGLAVPIVAALVGYVVVLFAPQVLNDGDTYWHITTGEWILRHGAVPRADPFSHSLAGAPWVAHEWLSEVLMALAYRAGSWDGIVMLFGVATALTLGLLAFHLQRRMDRPPMLLVLLLAAACIGPSLLARPHILALPLLELWTAGLLLARERGRAPTPLLLPLMAIWANLHGSFIFGLALTAPFALETVIEAGAGRFRAVRGWAVFIMASIAMSLATPQGWRGLLFPFRLMRMTHLFQIGEWQATNFQTYQPIELAVATLLYIAFTRGVRLPPLRLLIVLGLLHLALQHGRQQMVAGIVGALILAGPLGRAFGRDGRPAAFAKVPGFAWGVAGMVAMLSLGAIRAAYPIVRGNDPVSPVTALDHVPDEIARTPVFNDYSFGGYLVFRGVPPFIDGRADMYGDDFLSGYVAAMAPQRAAFSRIADRYGIRWTMLSADSPAVDMLDSLPGWRRLYADGIAVVHVRAAATP